MLLKNKKKIRFNFLALFGYAVKIIQLILKNKLNEFYKRSFMKFATLQKNFMYSSRHENRNIIVFNVIHIYITFTFI